MQKSTLIQLACAFWIFLGTGFFSDVGATKMVVRKPVWAGQFYPSARTALLRTIDQYTRRAGKTPLDLPPKISLRALILPHAGYIYSGPAAAHASRVIDPTQFDTVIIMGPDHRVGFSNCAISDVNAFQTPLGLIKLSEQANQLRRRYSFFNTQPASDAREHSIEVLLPFLQRYLKDFEMIPVVVGPSPIGEIANAIASINRPGTLLVVSSDLSHYLPYDKAVLTDNETINWILDLNLTEIKKHPDRACGTYPLRVLITLARHNRWQPKLLYYLNSGDSAGDKQRVVGYAAIAFYEEKSMKNNPLKENQFTSDQGQVLVQLARQTLVAALAPEKAAKLKKIDPKTLSADCYQINLSTFVTLTKRGQLRGCIGNLTATESVLAGVKQNALNAAFHDPRFGALTAEELNNVEIEVSVLTKPTPLDYDDGEDLLAKLRPNVDGLIIRKGYASATFLPQVWQQLPDPQSFLSHLCQKAGLLADAWRDGDIEVSTYQVQYFHEAP
jgi:MEMO1 family protein